MKLPKSILTVCLITFIHIGLISQVSGIYNINNYFHLIENKNLGVVVNQTSILDNTHLIDTLRKLDCNITHIFSPEHGFSGTFNAGEPVDNSLYHSKIPIISLYGKNKKLKDSDLKDIEILIFDIQDVGVRFYTYISTLHYVMEACARNEVKLIVLDRPNPHAHYVDGPVLHLDYFSFVGMHPVPVVYGMTIGEYALMINGEGWLDTSLQCDLTVVKISSYSRYDQITYDLFPYPSPNLRNMHSIFLYPSLCFFEGTLISVGRGTDYPFEVFGSPFFNSDSLDANFEFTPVPNFGSKNPKYNGTLCYGWLLSPYEKGIYESDISEKFYNQKVNYLNLGFLIDAYKKTPNNYKPTFFNSFFNKLAGNKELKNQIINEMSEYQIRESWRSEIDQFKLIRAKYLLYN